MRKEFFEAIKRGKLEETRQLLSTYPELINEKDENQLSPVMTAAYRRHADMLEFLIQKAGSLNIFEAAATGNTLLVLRHIARDPLLTNSFASDGFQPLGLACFFGHRETAERLIKLGAAVNAPSNNAQGYSPLQLAVVAAHGDIVLLLLENNANPNVREKQELATPLHAAAQKGDAKIILTLLYNGADLSLRNRQGKLPIDLAKEAGHIEAAALLQQGITRRFKAFRLPGDGK
jgi:ankyrin repeat protein